jgi:hypothetical protein
MEPAFHAPQRTPFCPGVGLGYLDRMGVEVADRKYVPVGFWKDTDDAGRFCQMEAKCRFGTGMGKRLSREVFGLRRAESALLPSGVTSFQAGGLYGRTGTATACKTWYVTAS